MIRAKQLKGIFVRSDIKTIKTLSTILCYSSKATKRRSLFFTRLVLYYCMVVGVLTSCTSKSEPTSVSTDTSVLTDYSTRLANLIKDSNPNIVGLSVIPDTSDGSSSNLIITGLTNSISGAPFTETINIDQSQGITTDLLKFTVTAKSLISPDTVTVPLVVTFDGESVVSYEIMTKIGGAPVNDWFASDRLNSHISATFGSQEGTFSTNDRTALSIESLAKGPPGGAGMTLSITGLTNSATGTGEIAFTLPDGFASDPATIEIPNPSGTGAAMSAPNPNKFTIIETGNAENSQEYTIANIELASRTKFTPERHIRITDGSTDITSRLTITDVGNNVIRIEGLTNNIGERIYTLTIDEEVDSFTTPGSRPIVRTITDPAADFSAGTGAITDETGTSAPTFALTNSGQNAATIYTLEVPFIEYRSPLTAANITARYGNVSATASDITIATNVITVSGFVNKDAATGETGSVMITAPTGYTVSPRSLPISDPVRADAIDVNVGEVIVTHDETGLDVSHLVIVKFSGVRLSITSADINEGSPLVIDAGATISIRTVACHFLAEPTVTVVGVAGGKIAATTPFLTYYDSGEDTLDAANDKYTVTRSLTVVDESDTVIRTGFAITLKFPACTGFTVGTGTATDAYEIDSALRLELVSHLVNTENAMYGGKYYKIVTDIAMGGPELPFSEVNGGAGFLPIGSPTAIFSGSFDCGNHTISGLYINRPDSSYVGLLGYISNASVTNCSLTDVSIKGSNQVGGLVGDSVGREIFSSTIFPEIIDCDVTGSVSGRYDVGGLIGRARTYRIISSHAAVTVTGDRRVGGLVGDMTNSSAISSYATGRVTSSYSYVGGLVGQMIGSSISNSYATGLVSGGSTAGGLVGESGTGSRINSSYATGEVKTIAIGGIVGGLVGHNAGGTSITDAYATGDVIAARGTGMVGGLVGSNASSFSIKYSYATGDVTGTSDAGLFIGFNGHIANQAHFYYSNNVRTSYYNSDAVLTVRGTVQSGLNKKAVGTDEPFGSHPRITANLTGRTRTQLQRAASHPGWQTSIWQFTPNNQYPRLKTVACANRQYNQDATACTGL
ncbi:hypothetical protein COTS27_00248 [Spirochaetota bacterium]|nr:hypothetical protein COTS27_00248 [Spirochaetota bacterium]